LKLSNGIFLDKCYAKVKEFDFFEYVVDKHNNVWKYIKSKDHFIKVTPWKDGEDRRMNRFQIENLINIGKLIQMKGKPHVHEIINERWDNDERSLEYNGMLFEVGKNFKENHAFDAPLHRFVHSYKTQDMITHKYTNDYRIGYFNGNLIWWTCFHFIVINCTPFKFAGSLENVEIEYNEDMNILECSYSKKTKYKKWAFPSDSPCTVINLSSSLDFDCSNNEPIRYTYNKNTYEESVRHRY